jgi:hypothetical protein
MSVWRHVADMSADTTLSAQNCRHRHPTFPTKPVVTLVAHFNNVGAPDAGSNHIPNIREAALGGSVGIGDEVLFGRGTVKWDCNGVASGCGMNASGGGKLHMVPIVTRCRMTEYTINMQSIFPV